ncbi:MAG: methylenetetrahydrofolate reductase [NAD(P)H] [Acidimicrobiia bacterium]|nr:methylenetetrahydrofolate reductase [NAD(P)H] [Acidimicrobiia bacterium]
MVAVSFEFFPPTTPSGRQRLAGCAAELARFDPAFLSVTYGAGGTSRERTVGAIAELTSTLDVPVAGHLTTINASKDDIHRVIDRYVELGVGHIVALRGDPPEDATPPTDVGYETAAELVTAIRSRPDGDRFDLSVAAYPEVHPKAASGQSDLDNLKRKVDAGADRAITQFFFDPDVFLRFQDRAVAAGVDVPIVPGIMPVANFGGVARFAGRCGATIPEWLSALLADLDDDPEVQQPVAAIVAAEQCRRLVEGGVDRFHFYTMNRRQLPAATCRALGLRARPSVATTELAP